MTDDITAEIHRLRARLHVLYRASASAELRMELRAVAVLESRGPTSEVQVIREMGGKWRECKEALQRLRKHGRVTRTRKMEWVLT